MNSGIFDTNIVSYFFNKHSLGAEYAKLITAFRPSISFATVGELHEGMNRANWGTGKRQLLQAFLKNYAVIESTPQICLNWGWIRYHRKRQMISENDAWIAATALAFDSPLVTHNAADFQNIPGLKILTAP